MIPKEVLEKVRLLEIRARHIIEDVFAGQYQSVFKGRGMEFEEVREYVPGDDIRTIDWNVTARMGQLFIKKHREERELTVLLLVDVSASQSFGSAGKTKSEIAAELCAVLAFSAIRNNDRVGLITFSDKVQRFIPPKKGKRHGMCVIREILHPGRGDDGNSERPSPKPTLKERLGAIKGLPKSFAALLGPGHPTSALKTNLGESLRFLNRVMHRRCIVFLISDFVSSDEFIWDLSLTGRRHDLTACIISDRREAELPRIGILAVSDPETGQTRVIDTADEWFRRQFAAKRRGERDELMRRLLASNVEFAEIPTSGDYVSPLVALFDRRKRRQNFGR